MDKNIKKKLICVGAALSLLVLLVMLPNYKIVEKISDNLLDRSFSFGLTGGIYSEDIKLKLATNLSVLEDAEIFYTTDGTKPDTQSKKYSDTLYYPVREELQVIDIRATVYHNGAQIGGPYEETYLLVKNPEMLKNMLLVSISIDEKELFDPKSGILYPAKSFIRADTTEKWNILHNQNFAKQGEAWERPAHVSIFEGDGRKVINQDCGLSVSGSHGSIVHYPFSLKLKADERYQKEKNYFHYDFFNEQIGIKNKSAYYNSLSLKNGGNDYNYMGLRNDMKGTMLRNSVGSRLAEECGVLTTRQRLALVYINGKFYNLTYLCADPGRKSEAVKTGLDEEYIISKKYPEKECFAQSGLKKEYHSFPDYSESDILKPDGKLNFERHVDMDDLFRYYAFECIVGNGDWPGNNYAMWRYIGNVKKENPFSDGKYRYWAFDLDCIYGLEEWLDDPFDAIFGNTTSDNCLLPILMQIPEYKEKFVNTVLDQLNTPTFSEEHILEVIDEENNAYKPWYFGIYGETAEAERERNVKLLKQKVVARKSQVYHNLEKYFHTLEPYKLFINKSDGMGMIQLNSLEFYCMQDFSGGYDSSYPVRMQYKTSLIDELDYWIVNGEKITEPELVITKDMIQAGSVTVTPVIRRIRRAGLIR